jgi:hypothetical protein
MQTANYIGYKQNNNIGVIPVALIAKAAVIVAPYVIKWGKSAFSSPAKDAKNFIANAKDTIISDTAENRIAKVIAYSQRINPKAIDVNTREWLKWYKQNYREDYKQISPELKIYWNNYLNSIRNTYGNVNRIFEDLDAAAFTNAEINFNATPVESVTNLFSSTGTGKINWVLYGAIGIGAILLIKYLK